MVSLRDIFRKLYPYAIFTLPAPLSSEKGGGEVSRCVYLTFDDGPIPEVTPKVLAILARYGVKATFFMVGENIYKHQDVFEQVAEAGHTIGNHTYNHLKGWHTSLMHYLSNVSKWEEAFEWARGIMDKRAKGKLHNRRFFRPPYGKATFAQRRLLASRGYKIIFWDILTRDYDANQTPEAMFDLIQKRTRPGTIINFHDSLKSNERMLAVLPKTIEWLQQQGYELRPL